MRIKYGCPYSEQDERDRLSAEYADSRIDGVGYRKDWTEQDESECIEF